MQVVAIQRCGGDEEARAARLAAITRAPLPAARARVQGRGPKLVAVTPDAREAQRVYAALSAEGFEPLSFDVAASRPSADRVSPRTFVPSPDALWGLLADGRSWSCPFDEVRCVLLGARFERVSAKRADPGPGQPQRFRWDRRPTGALVDWIEAGAPFVHVIAPGAPEIVLVEQNLSYEGLGAAMRPSRTANFDSLVDVLRSRCTGATFDDRLRTLEGQAETLGGLLDQHRFLDVAVSLLARSFSAPSGPYR